jgi:hypothetical protein
VMTSPKRLNNKTFISWLSNSKTLIISCRIVKRQSISMNSLTDTNISHHIIHIISLTILLIQIRTSSPDSLSNHSFACSSFSFSCSWIWISMSILLFSSLLLCALSYICI